MRWNSFVDMIVSNPFRAGGEALRPCTPSARMSSRMFQTPSERAVRRCFVGTFFCAARLMFQTPSERAVRRCDKNVVPWDTQLPRFKPLQSGR